MITLIFILILIITLILLPLRLYIIKEKRSLNYFIIYYIFALAVPIGTLLTFMIYSIVLLIDINNKYKITNKFESIKIGFNNK